MLEKMFKRKDVCEFIEELFSDNYNDKKTDSSIIYCDISSTEEALFTFFNALLKYEIIIETDVFLDEYVVQVRKLFKKLDNFHDINLGIATIIGKLCALKLNITNREDSEERRKLLQYVYNKYIEEGYFFHGFSGVYKEQIKRFGFVPEQYQHSYSKFIEIDKIFNKHNRISIMEKSFHENYIDFTDSFVMGCYYGVNSPMYFYRLLGGALDSDLCDKEAYFKNDYLGCFTNLNKLMKKARLNDYERKYITKICCNEWKVLQKGSANINVMLVKRKTLGLNALRDINDILNSDSSLGEAIFKIFSSRSNNIPVSKRIESLDIKFIEIPNYKVLFALRNSQSIDSVTRNIVIRGNVERLNNAYGKVSILILLGSLFIALGVILTIITISMGV